MKDQGANKPQPKPDPANLSQSELSSNESAVVVPLVYGERKLAVKWISPMYNQFTRDAGPNGKK